jgi:hypothetical protein
MQPSLEETVYLDFVTSSSTGAAADADSTPTAEVFEDATDTTVVALTVTKRTSKTGNYRVPVACTAANGFEAGKSYNVIASATIGGVAAKAKIGTFQCRARDTDDLATPTNITAATVTLADGVAHGGTTATLQLGSSTTTPALLVRNTRLSGSPAVKFEATGTGGVGFDCEGGTYGIYARATSDGSGVYAEGAGSGSGVAMGGGANGHGWSVTSGAASGDAISLTVPGSGRYVTQAAEDEFAARGWAAGTRTLTALGTDVVNAASLAADAAAEIADAVWDEVQSGHTTTGTFGKYLDAAVSGVSSGGVSAATIAAAVWDLARSGHATSGTFGETVGGLASRLPGSGTLSTLDAAAVRAAVGLASANLDTQLGAIDDYIDTEVAAIKAKTDNLPTDPADASDIAASFATVNSTLATIAGYIDTEVAAIKAKTDNLPASPAAAGSAMTLTSAYDFAKGTVAVTENYNADGSAPTPVQALLAIMQVLTEMSIAGTTMTVKKLDGTTTAFTLTLNDSVAPTSTTRAT